MYIFLLVHVHVSAYDIQVSHESQFTGKKCTVNIRPVKNKVHFTAKAMFR